MIREEHAEKVKKTPKGSLTIHERSGFWILERSKRYVDCGVGRASGDGAMANGANALTLG